MPPFQLKRRGRSWLAVLLLTVTAAGAAGAAPLQTASPALGMTAPSWLWRVAATRGQANAAGVSLAIRPSETVAIGSQVSFGVTARKPGYLLLVDIDAEGRISQVFPTPELLAQSDTADINVVKPGVEFVVPTVPAQQRGFAYVISPPAGAAVLVAILSERRVQLLDLPDLPVKLKSPADALSYLSAWTDALRVPDGASGKLLPNNWSLVIKPYAIK